MAIKDFIDEISDLVSDVNDKGFTYTDTNQVPNVDDTALTFESGADKKGKKIETCVLYTDIRDSVKLTEELDFDEMGKIYTAFTKSVLKIAEFHGAEVRNIIGDRVMLVFPVENCFTNAVECAVSINHAAHEINRIFKEINFKCGIGIDYGEMRVLKVGIQKKGSANYDNKNLVWVGAPANKASRLTDVANKVFEESNFEIKLKGLMRIRGASSSFSATYNKNISAEKFAEYFSQGDENTIWLEKPLEGFTKLNDIRKYDAILVSKIVFDNYKKHNSTASDIIDGSWEIQPKGIKSIEEDVYGTSIRWKIE